LFSQAWARVQQPISIGGNNPLRLVLPLTKRPFMPKFIDTHKINPFSEQGSSKSRTRQRTSSAYLTRTSYTAKRRTRSSAF